MLSSSTSMTSGSRLRLKLSPVDLPPLSSSMTDLLRVANDPAVSTATLERFIARDQAVALRVLTMANSSFYGCARQIESVRGAIALLGTKQVQNLASAFALAPTFESALGPGLWRHGLACALWSERIVRRLGLGNLDMLFTAALMHDIGIVMLVQHAPDRALPCLAAAEISDRPLVEVERGSIGWDHAELGAQLCKHWKLPERIWQLIEKHEAPPGADDLSHAALALGDGLARAAGMPELPWMAGTDRQEDLTPALSACGLVQADADALLSASDEVAAEVGLFG